VNATPAGFLPTGIVAVTVLLVVSIAEIAPNSDPKIALSVAI
jgi:hypothetical protein